MEKKYFNKNTKAQFDYFLHQKIEAGLVLINSEAKIIRSGHFSIQEGYCKIIKDEVFLLNCGLYSADNEIPKRSIKLLLHKSEITRLKKQVDKEGFTIIPLSVYANEKNKIKIEICLSKGKTSYNKKQVQKEKDIDLYNKRNF